MVLVVLAVAGLGVLPNVLGKALPSVDSSDVWISTVVAGDFVRQVRGVGTLVPVTDRWVTAQTDGVVEVVVVKPGIEVTADTVLAELRNPALERDYLQAQSDLRVAEAKLSALAAQLEKDRLQNEFDVIQAQLDADAARTILEAHEESLRRNVIPKLEFVRQLQEARTAEKLLEMYQKREPYLADAQRAQLESERALVEQLRLKLQGIEDEVAQLAVRAGLDGVLQELSVEEGERIEIGANVARVAKPAPLMAVLQIQEVQAKDVSVGLDVTIDTRNGAAQGTVTRVDPRVTDGSVEVDVAINSALPDGARPDQSITGTVLVAKVGNTLSIDRPNTVSAQSSVDMFVLARGSSRAERRQLRFGRTSTSRIEILSGVAPGDRVIVSDSSELERYAAIRVN